MPGVNLLIVNEKEHAAISYIIALFNVTVAIGVGQCTAAYIVRDYIIASLRI